MRLFSRVRAQNVPHPWVAQMSEHPRFGVLLNDPGADWSQYRDFAQAVEALGYDAFWLSDHPGLGFMDCWTTLGALSQATKTIRLGVAVSCVLFRPPWMLARLSADIDRLSNGRLILGVGIGDMEEEIRNFGLPLPGVRERQEWLEETVYLVRRLWTGEPVTFQGKTGHLENAIIQPGPIQRPSIPLLIGGGGEQTTLRQVAYYADMSNFMAHALVGKAFTLEDVKRKLNALRKHCESVGRDYRTILRSYISLLLLAESPERVKAKREADPLGYRDFMRSATMAGTPEEIIPSFQALVNCGIQYFIVMLYLNDYETLQVLAEKVIPFLKLPMREVETPS
ncbi:alkanesulfonate monooxygenase SsuD/methylene tetrahydromethanopterin reductase-like flavin-dependent oxidoreductase (luciferase family) [Thermosporothrix hazakensis]|uniref:Alkanesulfonate monooxygenase SsuD/methylene tetrahydromethanopterin reductase-like flavin-dependent oxidoreductase (Luciferase family) n=1 Tax=Thermosporothrix hazakensis TaxID=644383 RepID=A0A326UBY9_THEHA|nr:LLM class flavin-dependent oxidoreductase [Thermosporothrix hazakensis]PZW31202.1 alkanesulfonate monooxygenase SsuD/methylene tetrahydromethanopterin reductase-like flavin-dependent oxidoreductase (luciferase family) [Thermosporothrix hazakensis]GCE50888.1 hypothetical protein KTH_57570 [Thermosporothrix hazakensis]